MKPNPFLLYNYKISPASVFTLILAAIFQYLTRITVYTFLIVGTILMFGTVVYLWIVYSEKSTTTNLYTAILATILCVFWFVFLGFIVKKIELILNLYEIAAQLTFDQPMLIVISVVVWKCLGY